MKIEDIANPQSRFDTQALGDPSIKNCQIGDIFQLERVGFFRVDKIQVDEKQNRIIEIIYIPDGK